MYGLDPSQLRELIVKPVLISLGLYSDAACSLVLGTAMHESRLSFLKQLGTGPALGLWQMEPTTHDDLWLNFLKYRTDLAGKIVTILGDRKPSPLLLVGNLYYACAMTRVAYLRIPKALPDNDPAALAAFWKEYYNTPLGAGTIEQALPHFTAACALTPA